MLTSIVHDMNKNSWLQQESNDDTGIRMNERKKALNAITSNVTQKPVIIYVNEGVVEVSKSNYPDSSDIDRFMSVWKPSYPDSNIESETYSHFIKYVSTKVDYCNNNNDSSFVTGVIRRAVRNAGVIWQDDKRRVSRQFLTNLNIAQLQVIVNDLQRYIEMLNDKLVQLLMKRDELQMSQDATLIDIEDLSLYF
ncbi:uncharacterized protein LOC129760036 isoform X2 [Uranotaenia lowii]|uniref:uncharacterized protein LOC129760036 isoform X2 n=1 Tax=Uranotaenia lowii TaxID=190385 RepID=UPI0024789EC9|nr:uncharacterized protein LOC129760036 isoform X2 [Uranotaenia lowii]